LITRAASATVIGDLQRFEFALIPQAEQGAFGVNFLLVELAVATVVARPFSVIPECLL
jgi:hypothetical protein